MTCPVSEAHGGRACVLRGRRVAPVIASGQWEAARRSLVPTGYHTERRLSKGCAPIVALGSRMGVERPWRWWALAGRMGSSLAYRIDHSTQTASARSCRLCTSAISDTVVTRSHSRLPISLAMGTSRSNICCSATLQDGKPHRQRTGPARDQHQHKQDDHAYQTRLQGLWLPERSSVCLEFLQIKGQTVEFGYVL